MLAAVATAPPTAADAAPPKRRKKRKRKKKKAKKKKTRRKKKAKKAPPPREEVTITRWEYCDACKAVAEDLNRAFRDTARARGKGRHAVPVDGDAVFNELCAGERYKGYKPYMRYGCLKLLRDDRKKFLLPMARGAAARRMLGDLSSILEYKDAVCGPPAAAAAGAAALGGEEAAAALGMPPAGVGACTPNHLEDAWDAGDARQRTPCGACRVIVGDIERAVARLDTTRAGGVFDRTRLARVLDETCAELATRHARPAYLEEHCDELVDVLIGDGLEESQSALVATLVLRNRLSRSGFKPSDALEDKLCGELTGYRFCPKPAEPEPAAADEL